METIVPRYIQFITEAQKTWQEPGNYYKAGAGILPICETTGRMLLFMRTPVPGDEDTGKWATAGGMMSDKELKMGEGAGSREAALREFKEETGQDDPFTRLVSSYVYKSPDGGFQYYNFIGIVPDEFEPKLNKEHSEFKWFSLSDLKLVPRNLFHFGLKLMFKNDQSTIMKYAH
jgi:8-oxo-dGTP pyrophosphatase MutT (NUDIX family)